ncbi:MAG TPA: YetF domain-containing protein [Bacillota bacterium]|nr:YetF domain-containing protein [Bacillota bacterium]
MYDILAIIGRVIVLLLLLYLMIRWLGKKHLTQMTIFEYISGIVLGGSVAIHISSNTSPLLHGVTAIFSWTLLIVCIDTIALKSKRFRNFVHGTSRLMIDDGSFIYNHLRDERMTTDELLEALRTRNIDQLSDVEFAKLEPSGKLNVRTYDSSSESRFEHHLDKRTEELIEQMELMAEGSMTEELLPLTRELKHIQEARIIERKKYDNH